MNTSGISFTPTAQNFVTTVFLGSGWGVLGIWLLIVNAAAFFVYGLDKVLAKIKVNHPNVRRIPEKNLFLVALAGGALGAWLGMILFRHKTKHTSFRIGIPAILLGWIVLLVGLYVYFNLIR